MLEALQNTFSSTQLTCIFNDFYLIPVTFINLYGDLIYSCILDCMRNLSFLINVNQCRDYE